MLLYGVTATTQSDQPPEQGWRCGDLDRDPNLPPRGPFQGKPPAPTSVRNGAFLALPSRTSVAPLKARGGGGGS